MQGRTGVYWALKTNWGSFNWASAVGCAGMGLEPASGCESSTQATLPSNSAAGAVGSPVPSLLWTRSARPPHHWPCFNKAVGIHLQPARKRRKLAAPFPQSNLDSSQRRLKRPRGGEETFRREKQEGLLLSRDRRVRLTHTFNAEKC